MKLKLALIAAILAAAACGGWWWLFREIPRPPAAPEGFTGSSGCRDCHASFYEKWSTSWHGLALQPFRGDFARKYLAEAPGPIQVRGRSFFPDVAKGVVRERGPEGETVHPIEHALGGKNVFYFLTPRPGGKLQVLPVAFDSRRKEWYDTAASMVRHLRGETRDDAVEWTDRMLTFNTSCYGCHVSQLEKNYSLETDTYRTTWAEPGINCETCHGPGERHLKAMIALGGKEPVDIEIVSTKKFTADQMNSLCAPCHAKMSPLTAGFRPGDLFFDHYNLALLEDEDFYPDGRDLGENFTYTLWLLNPCHASGKLSCLHCHTSSGRDKHAGDRADEACLPCHEKHVKDPAAHSRHEAKSEGSRCAACHMPETEFARMRRHDHSLLPPAPSATIAFRSPNACNLCHAEEDAAWADEWVRKWYPRDYQAPLLHRAGLIQAARRREWGRLREMLSYVTDPQRSEVFAASILRLLDGASDSAKWPAFFQAARDPSPLVRASAAFGLGHLGDPGAIRTLAALLGDPYRVVRFAAASGLARFPPEAIPPESREAVAKAVAGYEADLRSRPDDHTGHYNLGNLYLDRGELEKAIAAFGTASRLHPAFVPARVNASIAQARLGNNAQAEEELRAALRSAPGNPEANLNLGLLLAETGRPDEAKARLRAALEADPRMAQAAYNLGMLLLEEKPEEALALLRRAAGLAPEAPRYAFALAMHEARRGDRTAAIEVLEGLLRRQPAFIDGILLLGSLYVESGRRREALELFSKSLDLEGLTPEERSGIFRRIEDLQGR